MYGIIVKRPKKEYYGFPLDIKEIDNLFVSYSNEELMNQIKASNMIPDLENSELAIGEMQNNKWVERKIIPVINDINVLEFSLPDFFKECQNPEIYCNYLYQNLAYLLKKSYISNELKHAIMNLKISLNGFIEDYQSLSYIEQRYLKYLFAKGFDISKNYQLQRTIIDEKKS